MSNSPESTNSSKQPAPNHSGTEILNCPCCSSRGDLFEFDQGFYIQCASCNLTTRATLTAREVITLWNNRPDERGEPVMQWSEADDLWLDGTEAEIASARGAGFKTRTLYRYE